MADLASRFTGSIPEHYDQALGPHIFEDYADEIAARVAALEPKAVLELAAGTGIVSRKLRDRLPAEVALTVSDLNGPMLDVARAKFGADENVDFGVVDAMSLDAANGSIDVVVCQFGVMFFPNKVDSFNEARRVLSPGGRYVFSVWSAMAENPFSEIAHLTGVKFFPEDPPAFYQTPFSYFEIDRIEADLLEAGFDEVGHEVIRIQKDIVDYDLFARGLTYGNPIREEIPTPEAYCSELAQDLQERFGRAPATMPLEAIVFVAQRV